MVTIDQLRQAARLAQANSYSPYSNYKVGCALLAKDGRIFTGTNVENSSYGGTICAERVAFTKAVSEGCREFELLVVTTEAEFPAPPCGICRQFMGEFLGADVAIVLFGKDDCERRFRMGELFPYPFSEQSLH